MALVMALIVSSLLLVSALFLWRSNQDDLPRAQLNVVNLQKHFLAKGAQEIARLKIKLLPTPAYDAASFAVGRNPYFDHSATGYSQFRSSTADRAIWHGPLFFTGTATWGTGDYLRDPNKLRDVNLDGVENAGDQVGGEYICELYLKMFGSDLKTGVNQLKVDSSVIDPITGIADPFSGTFTVSKIKVLGYKSGQRYNEEAIQVTVTAVVQNARIVGANLSFQRDFESEQTTTYRVTRNR
jgi:hypothetical protein